MEASDLGLVLIPLLAVAAPLLARGVRPVVRVPIVVFELVLGILVGPAVLGWVEPGPLLERRFSVDGHYIWEAVGPTDAKDGESRANYQDRRRKADPDLWLVELDIADAPRLVAEWGALT